MMASTAASYREITDANGRIYRVGETDRELLGMSRAWMVWLPWLAMVSISVFEYGYGAAEDTIRDKHGWSLGQTFWIVTIWAVFQAGIAFPAGRLREKNIVSARTAMLLGALLTCIGFFSIASFSSLPLVWIGYSVLGGTGAGLVYATCINMVSKWYPEKKGARTGFVNGGFAYGAVPFIYVFTYWFHPSNFKLVMSLIGLYMLVVIGACALFFKDPPKNWWPADIDPNEWRKATKTARANTLAKNPPAVRQLSPIQALKTGQLELMWIAFLIVGSVSLFGSAYQVPFAKDAGFGPFIAASSAGVLSVVNGVGRAAVGWVSDYLGRKQTLVLVLIIEGLAQFGLLWSGKAGLEIPFLIMAFVAGFGGGAFFPLFAAITPDYFGENDNASNYGLVYSAKLPSAILGIGIGSSLINALGYTWTYTIGGLLAIVAAIVIMFLRQPGRHPAPIVAKPMVNRARAKPVTSEDVAIAPNWAD